MADIVLGIPNLRTLKRVLRKYKVPIDAWNGEGHILQVEDLFEEICFGDCVLILRTKTKKEPIQLIRKVWRAQTYIFRIGKFVEVLVEHQQFHNGHEAPCDRDVVSEKQRKYKSETARAACIRCFKEELQIILIGFGHLIVKLRTHKSFSTSSRSYPGLPTESHITYFRWIMPKEYWRDEYIEVGKKKTSIFSWVRWDKPIPVPWNRTQEKSLAA